jgi:hypothetical protein
MGHGCAANQTRRSDFLPSKKKSGVRTPEYYLNKIGELETDYFAP